MAYSEISYRHTMIPDWCEKIFRSENSKFWYYFIPKNASSSFREVKHKSGVNFFHHDRVGAKFYWHTNKPAGAKTIIILREPFDRLISSYCWDVREGVFNDSVNSYMEHIAYGYPSAEAIPQTTYLKTRSIELENINYVWFTETLKRQLGEFCVENSLDLVLPVVNVSTSQEREVVEKEMRWPHNYEIFRKEYAQDIEMYNTWWSKING